MKKIIIIAFVTVSAIAGSWFYNTSIRGNMLEPIKVGVLHSLTGTMAISEASVVDATMMAIEEINEKGGILGRDIKPLVVDGCSDLSTFAREAERLISGEEVSVVFGCWTSASRKTVKPIFEEHDGLLFYPVQYEGLEQSPNIIYTGAAPNQQIIPAVKWSFDNLGKRFFLVGSDYVFPRSANAIIMDQAEAMGAEIVGEEYVLLGSDDVKGMVDKIASVKPDVIINTINGDSNIAFFRELHNRGIKPDEIPTMSFSIAEGELQAMGIEHMVGNYACWNYFQSVDTERNEEFVRKFKNKYGADRVVSDPMEAGYFGVRLWELAVNEAGTADVDSVRTVIKRQSLKVPEGMVYLDPDNNHTWKTVRIGKIGWDGQFNIVWDSKRSMQPVPYPPSRSRHEWDQFLQRLFVKWDGKWQK
ncbi:MAG: urea ABC transporter substrate-binding protein [Planctomycetes bacterium]|nr:urea ABC transporter substrate-binding protein [Planctomycetota bacterium]